MGETWNKFSLLMWKNWKLQIRQPIQTFLEIFFPVLLCLFLVLIRSLADLDGSSGRNYYPFFPTKNLSEGLSQHFKINIAYYPDTTRALEFVKDLEDPNTILRGFNSTQDMETYLMQTDKNGIPIGIEFDSGVDTFPDKIHFNIRTKAVFKDPFGGGKAESLTESLFPKKPTTAPMDAYSSTTPNKPGYEQRGFLALQYMVSRRIIEKYKENDPSQPGINITRILDQIKMQRYPVPSYTEDVLLKILDSFIAFMIIMAFIYPVINITKNITAEKEKQLKESMKIMGLSNWMHWTAWFVKSLMFLLITIVCMVFVWKTDFWYGSGKPAVLPRTDAGILFLFLLLYTCATITFCFMVSVFFSKANLATTFVWLLFLFSHQPYVFNSHKTLPMTMGSRIGLSTLSNTAVGFGLDIMFKFESIGKGVQWGDIWSNVTPDEDLMLGHILIMFIVDAILYLLIALYVEAVWPGIYGVPKKWYFIFQIFNWGSGNPRASISPVDSGAEKGTFEPDPENFKAGIEIKKLRKVYDNKKVAVKNFTLNMYENQITALLGHNGAGKTTTISMLTGMYRPTSGSAIVNGHDIVTDSKGARSSIGICPQHNVLFDDLTVQEHIYFYGRLKGLNKKAIDKEVEHYLKLLKLQDKINNKIGTLSGGMQRKLSVAVAFCGHSKVIMLDEPTAGLDPAARRSLWEFIETQKRGRTILLTTHFMDEADLLGDRIAIMSGGTVQCCGSSFFLKKKYGKGYNLIIEKLPTCKVYEITDIIRNYIPDIKSESEVGSELIYLLDKEKAPLFQDMLKDIEDRSANLGINGYGISLTTMEEVFMKVGAETRDVPDLDEDSNKSSDTVQFNMQKLDLLTGGKLLRNQVWAMFLKRYLCMIRSWWLLFIQIVLSVVYLITNLLVIRENLMESTLLDIGFNSYKEPVTILSTKDENNPFYLAAKTSQENVEVQVINTDITDYLLELTNIDKIKVDYHYIASSSFENDSITAWFNNGAYHSPPLALSQAMNSVFKTINKKYEISISNYPLPHTQEDKLSFTGIGSQLAITIAQCVTFVTACYILFYIKERLCKAKHLQIVSGMNVLVFWFVSFLCDWLTFFLSFILFAITIICFQEDGYKTMEDIGMLLAICMCFQFAMLPIIYLLSLVSNLPSSGFIRVILMGTLGIVFYMVVMIVSIPDLDLEDTAKLLDGIFVIFPFYCLPSGLSNYYKEYTLSNMCIELVNRCNSLNTKDQADFLSLLLYRFPECIHKTSDYFSWDRPGILRELIVPIIMGVVLMAWLMGIEVGFFRHLRAFVMRSNLRNTPIPNEDEDVRAERERVKDYKESDMKHKPLVMRNLTKFYKKFQAVNGASLAINTQECFGLLGVNGAGKTSTFKMMTGDTRITFGDVYINGMDLKNNQKEINKITGYCPQFDALFEELTARETIKIFGMIRGFTAADCKYMAERLAIDFDFYPHLDKEVRALSGGNKRKLSTAVALIGEPTILYLDEPTTGMDPASKRRVWDQLCRERDKGKCLVLTSHSMEECEALCTRIAIMVQGSFKCLGSTQHLKNRFSPGYTLTIKLQKDDQPIEESVANVKTFVAAQFPSAVLKEHYQQLLTFNISDMSIPWSQLFAKLEGAKKKYNIEDYTLGQSSLEQVFLRFAYASGGDAAN